MPATHHDPVLRVDDGDALGTVNADFDSVALNLRIGNCTKKLSKQTVENPLYVNAGGANEHIVGLSYPDSSVGFDTEAQGLLTAASDGVTAAKTGVTLLLEACLGQSASLSTGSTVASASSASVITETDNGNHALGDMAVVALSTGDEMRPIIAYDTGQMTFPIALSGTPVGGEEVYGTASVGWVDRPSGGLQTAQMKLIGNDAKQNWTVLGAVGSLSIPENPPTATQPLSWSFRCANYTDLEDETKIDPGETSRTVIAGGEFLLAKEGISQPFITGMYGSIAFTLNASYLDVVNPNDPIGIQDWLRAMPSNWEFSCHVPHDFDLSAATAANGSGGLAMTAGTWREAFETKESTYQALIRFGLAAGGYFCVWMRSLYLYKAPEQVELNNIASDKLMFRRKTGLAYANTSWAATVPELIIAQG